MATMTHALNWFEIPVDDFDRAKMFYGRLFDCDLPEVRMGASRMSLLPCDRGEGGVGGAIVETEDFLPSRTGTLVYLNGGDDLSVALRRVDDAGGKVLQDKTRIAPELGFFATFLDSEGNKVALHSMG